MRYLSFLFFLFLLSCQEQAVNYNEPLTVVWQKELLRRHPERAFPEHKEYVELEGFYTEGLEVSNFNLLQDGKLLGNLMWTEFDSLANPALLRNTRIARHGVYMKVGGTRQWGRCYGHFGASDSKLTVTRVLEIDTTSTRFDYVMDKVRQNGYYQNGKDTYYLPTLFKPNTKYWFRGEGRSTERNRTVYELTITTNDGITLNYYLAPVKNKGELIYNGKLNLSLNCFLNNLGLHNYSTEYLSEDVTEYYMSLNFPKDKKNGSQVVNCTIEGPDHFSAYLTEVHK